MSELSALSNLLSKPEESYTPIEKVIVTVSALDEDLANHAAEQYEMMVSEINKFYEEL